MPTIPRTYNFKIKLYSDLFHEGRSRIVVYTSACTFEIRIENAVLYELQQETLMKTLNTIKTSRYRFFGILCGFSFLLLSGCGGGSEEKYQLDSAERNALISIYKNTGGDKHWHHDDNWWYTEYTDNYDNDGYVSTDQDTVYFPPPECTWYGITCDEAHKHVVAIDLSNNNLIGKLPLLTALTELERVDVSGNPNLDVSLWTAGGMPSSVTFIH